MRNQQPNQRDLPHSLYQSSGSNRGGNTQQQPLNGQSYRMQSTLPAAQFTQPSQLPYNNQAYNNYALNMNLTAAQQHQQQQQLISQAPPSATAITKQLVTTGTQKTQQSITRPPISPQQITPQKPKSSPSASSSSSRSNSASSSSSKSKQSASSSRSESEHSNSESSESKRSSSNSNSSRSSSRESNKSASQKSSRSSSPKDKQQEDIHKGQYQGRDGQWFKSAEELTETRKQVELLHKEHDKFEKDLNKLFPFLEISNRVFAESSQSQQLDQQQQQQHPQELQVSSNQFAYFNSSKLLSSTQFADTQPYFAPQAASIPKQQASNDISHFTQNNQFTNNNPHQKQSQKHQQHLPALESENNPVNISTSSSSSAQNRFARATRTEEQQLNKGFTLENSQQPPKTPLINNLYSSSSSGISTQNQKQESSERIHNQYGYSHQNSSIPSKQQQQVPKRNSGSFHLSENNNEQQSNRDSLERDDSLTDNNFSFKRNEQRFLRTKKN